MLVVSEAAHLMALQQIDELKLLQGRFGEVVIPPAVACARSSCARIREESWRGVQER